MVQSVIARLEHANGTSLPSLRTVMRLSAVFDVALAVRFEAFSLFADHLASLSPAIMAPKSYGAEVEAGITEEE